MSTEGCSDADLLEQWRQGTQSAGQALFERHYAALDRFFRNKAGQDCQELLQRSFLACLEKRDTLRNASSFRAFLFGVARFELLRYFNERRRQADPVDPARSSLHDLQTSPSCVIAERQERRLLAKALPRLPLDLQITVELHYWEGLSATEIGDVVGIPPGTVKSRLRRAKRLLFTEIDKLSAGLSIVSSQLTNLDSWAAALDA
ncbi:MAG: RNA polymerase sigma factor [Myxococcota bacterium]